MIINDAKSLDRTALYLVVEYKLAVGSPPNYRGQWQVLPDAKVNKIVINFGNTPNSVSIKLPAYYWHELLPINYGARIRIRTDYPGVRSKYQTTIFSGFATGYQPVFSGGTAEGGAIDEVRFSAHDHRWLLGITSPVFGQIARTAADYVNYGTSSQTPRPGYYHHLSGRRCIFNADGKPNSDPNYLEIVDEGAIVGEVPIFGDTENAEYWTVKDMVRYILSPYINLAKMYLPVSLPFTSPETLSGLSNADWNATPHNVCIEGLNALESLEMVARNIGWSFYEYYPPDPDPGKETTLVFFSRGGGISHKLYAPPPAPPGAPYAVNDVHNAVRRGKKILWAGNFSQSILDVINNPWGLGAPKRFEFTAELVPAWLDSGFSPSATNTFFSEAQLQEMTAPDTYDYYKYYHVRGSAFRRDVGRKWALNESGRYTDETTYDRGTPFDFGTVLPGLDNAPYTRRLLPCLTQVDNNSVGIVCEFSFDSGTTWQTIPAVITNLDNECGLWIAEPNLAELVDSANGTISGGPLDGQPLNLYTSLADDKLNSRSFKNGAWKTRVRITASVLTDQRLALQILPSGVSGSPFYHSTIVDLSDSYQYQARTQSSVLKNTQYSSDDIDDTAKLSDELFSLRSEKEPAGISGRFTLERLWLGDGSGQPDFQPGDVIYGIEGRDIRLTTSISGISVHPEIVQIIYNTDDTQMMTLITKTIRTQELI